LTTAGFSIFELFSDWDSEEVFESLLPEAVDWVVRMVFAEEIEGLDLF